MDQDRTIDQHTIDQVKALATLTGRATNDLFDAAVGMLRQHLVPSTKPVAVRTPKAKKAGS